MTNDPFAWIHDTLSLPRFGRYLRWAGGDTEAALRLYWWNIEISAAFYGLLHCLELSLRNSLNEQLRRRYGRSDWWSVAPLSEDRARKISKAVQNAREAEQKRSRRAGDRDTRGAGGTTHDDIVAELTFGFWVSLLSRRCDRTLWVPTLHRAFPHHSGPRQRLQDNLESMVYVRNRVMHYEPIHYRDLAADHAKVYRLLGYMSPEMVNEARALDRVPEVLARRKDVCDGNHPPRF